MTLRITSSLALILVASTLIIPNSVAGTTFIDFVTDAGNLTDQSPPGILTGASSNATNNKGVFSDAGTAFLFSGSSRVTATQLVTLNIRLNVATDTAIGSNNNNADLCMFVADANDINTAVIACFDGIDHPSTASLIGPFGSINLAINLPATTDNYILEYDPAQDRATLSRVNTPQSVSIFNALDGATSFVMGLTTDGGPIQLRQFTATGADIPDFPSVGDPLDPNNPWLDFGVTSGGNGAMTDPFNTLASALAAANPAATISISPGTDSTETPTITQNVTLANADSGSGSVSIGVTARSTSRQSGFISKKRQNE